MSRRQMTKLWEAEFEKWRRTSAKYGDRFTRIETIEMWEACDDKPADVIVVCNAIEHQLDVDAAMANIKSLARIAVVFAIKLDWRTLEDWQRIIGRHLTVVKSEQFADRVVLTAVPLMQIPMAKIVAAGNEEIWWDNIVKNTAAIKKRVPQADPHGRRAIIACYGPSLGDNLSRLVEEDIELGDIISVSGSHDFLLKHDIIPDYHVECDPRPHKADNINMPSHEVQYLLGSMVSPVLIEKLDGYDVALWHSSGPLNMRLIDTLEPDAWVASGGGSVGLRAIGLLYEMGYRNFSMYGMDCSYSDDGEVRWAGPHANKRENHKDHPICHARCLDRTFTTSPVLLQYAGSFFDTVKFLPDTKFRVYGDSLLQTMCLQFNHMNQAEAA